MRDGHGARRALPHRGRGPADLIETAYQNPDGTRVVYGLAFDLDVHRASAEWLDGEGRLDGTRIIDHLDREHGEIARCLSHVTRSSGGKGLALVLAINPLPLLKSTARNQLVAQRLQNRLIALFIELGLGADPSARGLVRAYSNYEAPGRLIRHDREIQQRISRDGEPVLTNLHRYLDGLDAERRRERRLYPDARVETGLARLFEVVMGLDGHGIPLLRLPGVGSGGTIDLTVKEIQAITGTSFGFIRRRLLVSPPAWLSVQRLLTREDGWRLSIAPGRLAHRLLDRVDLLVRRVSGTASRGPRQVVGLSRLVSPELVEDGARNAWVTSVALALKWTGVCEEEARARVTALVGLVPSSSSSRNCRSVRSIVKSIYRNVPENFGRYAGHELPSWLMSCVPSSKAAPCKDSQSSVISLRRPVGPVALPEGEGLWESPLTADELGQPAPVLGVIDAASAEYPLPLGSVAARSQQVSRRVQLVAIRRRQRVGVFEGARLIACVTRRHYRASRMVAWLERRPEYHGLDLVIHTPHRSRQSGYFAAIDAHDVPLCSGTVLGLQPTFAMRLRARYGAEGMGAYSAP